MGGLSFCHFLFIWWSIDEIGSQNLKDFLASSDRIESLKIVNPVIESLKETRAKRSSLQRISLQTWTLETYLNEHLTIAPGFVAHEGRDHDDPSTCEVRHGFVIGQPDSLAAITVCSNSRIYGLVHVADGTFFVHPLTDGRHILYKTIKALIIHPEEGFNAEDSFSDTRSEEKLTVNEDGLQQLLDYVDYLRANNLNTSNENDILPGASRRSETVWTGLESKYKRDEILYVNSKSRVRRQTKPSGKRKRAKRNLMICNTREFYNLTGDMIDVQSEFRNAQEQEETEYEYEDVELPLEEDSEHVGYFFDRAWERNKLPSE